MAPFTEKNKSRLAGASVVIFLLVLIAFSPAFSSRFVNWDDPVYVTDNPLIRSLDWSSVAGMFSFETIPLIHHYVPLVLISYSIEYYFAGLDPAVFHGTNVILHGISAVLVFWIVLQLSGSLSFSFFAALLFAVHPLRVESVAWVTERKDMLSGVTFFGALLSYVLYLRHSKRRSFLVLTWVMFLCSLLSKAMAISFPVVLMLVDSLQGRKVDRQSLLEKAPFFALSIAFGILALLSQPAGTAVQQTETGSLSFSEIDRIFIASYAVLFYAVKFFAPVGLSVLYKLPATDVSGFPWYVYLTPIVVIAGIAALIFYRKKTPMLVFGGLFFFVTLGPVSQIIPVGVATIADRFTYIPYFGFILLAASALLLLRDHVLKQRGIPGSATTFFAVAWVVVLVSASVGRTKVWYDDITLWTSVIDQPSPPAMAYLQRGLAHAGAMRPREAVVDYTRAIQQDSTLTLAWNNRGNVFARMGNYDQAVSDYGRAIAASPTYADAYVNRGRAFMLQKKYSESAASYRQALELDSTNAQAHYNLGLVYLNLGELDSALAGYNRALALNPEFTEAYVRRGDIYFQELKFKEAIADYTEGINRGSSHEILFTNRGSSYANLGEIDRAIEDFNKALEINPNYTDAILNRGIAFIAKKDYRLALVHFNMLENMGLKQDPKVMKFLREQAAAQQQ